MIVTNTEDVPGMTIRANHGIVTGSTVRAKHVGRDIMAGLKSLFGGELRGYTELLGEARQQAVERMKSEAKQRGANAVVNVRFTTSTIMQGASELFAYGTAVTLDRSDT